jgi:hypothetical protein
VTHPLPFNENCPRCGQPFRCGAQDDRCDCFDLKLTPELREQIARDYSDCLCVSCLKELALATPASPAN